MEIRLLIIFLHLPVHLHIYLKTQFETITSQYLLTWYFDPNLIDHLNIDIFIQLAINPKSSNLSLLTDSYHPFPIWKILKPSSIIHHTFLIAKLHQLPISTSLSIYKHAWIHIWVRVIELTLSIKFIKLKFPNIRVTILTLIMSYPMHLSILKLTFIYLSIIFAESALALKFIAKLNIIT